MDALQIVLVAPPGPNRDQLLSYPSGAGIQLLDSVGEFLEMEREGEGIILLGPGLPAEEILGLVEREADQDLPWASILVREASGEFHLRPLSMGHVMTPARVSEIAADPGGQGPVLELHSVLRVVAKARHDLNNPLTSGLAEAQLLLMDEHPEEVQESLETIQEQFRRLRDMVADMSRLRVPRKDKPIL